MLCGFSSLWWPFGWNWSYLGFLGIIWRTCGSKCQGEGGGIFPTLCVECCLVDDDDDGWWWCGWWWWLDDDDVDDDDACTVMMKLASFILINRTSTRRVNASPTQQYGCHFVEDIFKWILMSDFWGVKFKLHCSFLLRVQFTVNQCWFSECLGAEQATCHYLNQCWPN